MRRLTAVADAGGCNRKETPVVIAGRMVRHVKETDGGSSVNGEKTE